MNTIFFNAHHAPMGAFATFTLGYKGAKGGFGLEIGKPADQNVYIGLEGKNPGVFKALPFYATSDDERKRYIEEDLAPAGDSSPVLDSFRDKAISRQFKVSSDTWLAGDLRFSVYSPFFPIPDPLRAPENECMLALVPAVLVELTVDNLASGRARRAFLGYQGNDPYSHMRVFGDESSGLRAVGQGRITALATIDPHVKCSLNMSIEKCLDPGAERQRVFGLGHIGSMLMDVPAGTKQTFRFALCFHREGMVTTGIEAPYWYTRYFRNIEAAALFALRNFDTLKARALEADAAIEHAGLSDDQRFQMALAIRSYYGSTELLEWQNRPFWIVNEGEYRMINTFDLTVDHVFFETRMNPWTVRNTLDMFADRFSYRDKVLLPGNPEEFAGGISFTHDMGVANAVSPPGYSSYEQPGIDGCFSYMSHEQLVNWLLCAGVYFAKTHDENWLSGRMNTVEACFLSMLNRDHPDPARRTGIMKLDSSRAASKAEITTYDSLDASLGQARNNLYLAVKCWAAYVFLEFVFLREGKSEWAQQAAQQASRCAQTLLSHVKEDGHIPAVIDENNDSRIIPAIEGLVFPLYTGSPEALNPSGRFGALVKALKKHFETIMVRDVCLFDDGGWKLSSTSTNSWLSKIYLCQFVARKVLGVPWTEKARRSDAAHVAWLQDPGNAYYSWSDQMHAGVAKGSLYYPRGVTSVLWLDEQAA
jgi:xylan 1,4-beta-xylosidase